MRASCRPCARADRIVVAISCPNITSKSATDSHAMGSKAGFHQGCRSPIAPGGWAQQASARARSHPWGRKPAIIEPASVVKRFMVSILPGPGFSRW